MYRKVYYKSAQPVLDNVYCIYAVKVIISSQLWVLKNIYFKSVCVINAEADTSDTSWLSSLPSPFLSKARCRYSRDLNIGCPNSGNF